MAWEEQRRLRAAGSGDTARIEGLPVAAPADPATVGTGDVGSQQGRAARAERWERFGWMTAVAIAVIALVVALLAFANSGWTQAAASGRAGAFAPSAAPAAGLGARIRPRAVRGGGPR